MSKFKVKGVLDDVIKFIEFTRGSQLTLNDIKSKLERKFGSGSLTFRYRSADGRVQACYQDFHVQDALNDSLKSGLKDLVFLLTRDSPSQYIPSSITPSVSIPSTTTRKANYGSRSSSFTNPTQPSPPTTSPSRPLFCESCGNAMSATARFCSSCGSTRSTTPEPGMTRPPIPSSTSTPLIKTVSTDKICAGCGRSLGSSGLKALEKAWHKECFNCSKCKNSLLNSAFVEDEGTGAPLCGNCYDDLHAKKCTKCKRAISGTFLNVEGFDYHKECFVCGTCNSQFTAGYFMKNGLPTCDKCV